MSESATELLNLQRSLVDLALDPDTSTFLADPGAYAARRGLPPRHQEAFRRSRDRLHFYRDGIRSTIWEPIQTFLPLTRSLLEKGGAWEECRTAFLAARALESPHYRDIAPTFLGWLASTGWGGDRWPALLEFVHFELVQELVEHLPEEDPPSGLHPSPGPRDHIVLAPATQVVTYAHAVHEATVDQPGPPERPCSLLACRDPEGRIHWRELTPAAAALLVRAQDFPIEEAAAALGLEGVGETLEFLGGLCECGAIQGFRNLEAN